MFDLVVRHQWVRHTTCRGLQHNSRGLGGVSRSAFLTLLFPTGRKLESRKRQRDKERTSRPYGPRDSFGQAGKMRRSVGPSTRRAFADATHYVESPTSYTCQTSILYPLLPRRGHFAPGVGSLPVVQQHVYSRRSTLQGVRWVIVDQDSSVDGPGAPGRNSKSSFYRKGQTEGTRYLNTHAGLP